MTALRVGVLFDVVGAYGRGVFRGINRYRLLARHWRLTIPPLWVHWAPVEWEQWDVDAYIAQVSTPKMMEALVGRGLPVVNVSSRTSPMALPSVVPDDAAIGRLAAEHFLDRGFRSFAFLGRPDAAFSTERKRSFQARVAEAGYEVNVFESPTDIEPGSVDQNRTGETAWLRSLPRSTALFAYTDQRAANAMVMCARLGIGVPEQLAILGVDDDELFRDLGGVSLSSIRTPSEEIGYQAAAMLDLLVRGQTPEQTRIACPPRDLIARQSSDTIAIHDPEIALAVRYIREHAHEFIRVEDVINSVVISRRSLERRFRDALGRTPLEEINRVRTERARQLLTGTTLAVPEVARRSGFSNATYMTTVFRQRFGVSMREYRRKYGIKPVR